MLGFGPDGWGPVLVRAGLMTLAVSICAFVLGLVLGTICAWGRIAGNRGVQRAASIYVVVLRGIPDLLVIYLFYFGGRQVVAEEVDIRKSGFIASEAWGLRCQ